MKKGMEMGQLPWQPAVQAEALSPCLSTLVNMYPKPRLIFSTCRSDEERERDGTAALTAGAIGRGAAVPLPFIGGSLSRNVRNADELAYQIAATVATGLVQVGLKCSSTQIMIAS